MSHDSFSASAENREQAEKAKAIAQEALKNGDFDKAVRFLEKAKRLHASPDIDQLIARVWQAKTAGSTKPASSDQARPAGASSHHTPASGAGHAGKPHSAAAPGGAKSDSHARPSHSHASGTQNTHTQPHAHSTTELKYTVAEHEEVKGKLKIKDYYELLEVTKSCSEDDLKRAYRKVRACRVQRC